jgi:heme exporter protein A
VGDEAGLQRMGGLLGDHTFEVVGSPAASIAEARWPCGRRLEFWGSTSEEPVFAFFARGCSGDVGRFPLQLPSPFPKMESRPAPLLAVDELACERGERLLFRSLRFGLGPGQVLLVQGGNGQGKTSLLRLLAGLARPDAGEVRWRGEPIARCRDTYHREMAYLGHANGIKDELEPAENLRFRLGLQGRAFDAGRALKTLDRLGLSRCLELPCRALSFGQRRRVALAALLLADARLWILDEPLTGLDVHAVAQVEGLIRDHLQAGGLLVATTHQALNLAGADVQHVQLGLATPSRSAAVEAL